MPRPATAPNRIGRRNSGVKRQHLDHQRRSEIQREPVDRGAQHGSHYQGDPAAQRDCEQRRDDRRTSTQRDARDDRSHGGRRRDQHRLEHQPELRHAEVEFDLIDRHSDQQPAAGQITHESDEGAVFSLQCTIGGRVCLQVPFALVLQHEHREQGEVGAADHHQMGGAPQRHVLAEDAMPDVVEREADHRVHSAAGHQQRRRPARASCG